MRVRLKGFYWLLCWLSLSTQTFAGGDSSGGGDAIICHEGTPQEKVFLADTFPLFYGTNGQKNLEVLNSKLGSSIKQDVETLFSTIDVQMSRAPKTVQNRGIADELRESYKRLTFVKFLPTALRPKLEALDDDNIQLDAEECVVRQLAIQNITSGVVEYDDELLSKITPGERSLFRLHEAFIHLRRAPENTTPVRNQLLSILQYSNLVVFLKSNALLDLEKQISLFNEDGTFAGIQDEEYCKTLKNCLITEWFNKDTAHFDSRSILKIKFNGGRLLQRRSPDLENGDIHYPNDELSLDPITRSVLLTPHNGGPSIVIGYAQSSPEDYYPVAKWVPVKGFKLKTSQPKIKLGTICQDFMGSPIRVFYKRTKYHSEFSINDEVISRFTNSFGDELFMTTKTGVFFSLVLSGSCSAN